MGDVGDDFRALREYRSQQRATFGMECPRCKELRPRTSASILLPGQRCRVDGYRDPREQEKQPCFYGK